MLGEAREPILLIRAGLSTARRSKSKFLPVSAVSSEGRGCARYVPMTCAETKATTQPIYEERKTAFPFGRIVMARSASRPNGCWPL